MTLTPLFTPTLDDARAVLRTRFGFDEFRPGQAQAIEALLAGRDTLVVLPTGGGKSLCYQVPALCTRGLTVVVSPLISLMKDQVDALVARGVDAAFINSTLSGEEVRERLVRAQAGRLSLLYVAPERFEIPSFADRLKAIGVALLAVDEAHCISEWGHDFRPSYMRIGEVRARLGTPPTIALTATATPQVRDDIARILGLRDPEIVVTGFDRPNLWYGVIPVKTDEEKDATLRAMLDGLEEGTAVVYAATRKDVEKIGAFLDGCGIPVAVYHAGLDDARRHAVQERFMSGKARVIVATNSFGMGVDKSDVRLVVHYTMPGTLEAYYQEAGRAGRDREPSRCILLHKFPDRKIHEFFIAGSFPERDLVRQVHRQLKVECDATGRIDGTAQQLAAGIGARVNVRGVESAMRLLGDAGVLRWDPDQPGLVHVRLLATPERIREELGDAGAGVALLRALWRVAKSALQRGTVIDLNRLPRELGGTEAIHEELDALERRSFVEVRGVDGGLRLVDRGASFEQLPIDWATLERRRRYEIEKLDAVQRYAYTDHCRRAMLLRWFGDPAARRTCEGCDNCTGEKLVAVAGSRSGFAPRPRGERARRERAAPRERSAAARTREPRAAAATDAGPPVDDTLLAALKRCRTELAREQRVPAYVIFPDATLVAFARERPHTPNEMATIPGVGDVKLARYGTAFIAVIKTHLAG